MRTPLEAKYTALDFVATYEIEFDGGNIMTLVTKSQDNTETTKTLFGHNNEEIEQLGKSVFNRDLLTEYHKESIRLIFICAELFRGHVHKHRPLL